MEWQRKEKRGKERRDKNADKWGSPSPLSREGNPQAVSPPHLAFLSCPYSAGTKDPQPKEITTGIG